MKNLNGLHVLIVEDDQDLRDLISEDFSVAGALVEVAASGHEAVILIKEKKFDFVLSDLRMPNGDGRFLAKEVLKMAEPKPVVFLYSGYIDIDESTFNKLGIKQIFTKPFSTVAMINSILRDLKTRTAA